MDILLQIILTAAVIMDVRTGKIDNRFLGGSMLTGVLLQISVCGAEWYFVLLRAAFPAAVFWLLFRMRVLGAGDIKLFSVIGCFWSFQNLLYCIGFSFAAGAVFSLIRLIRLRELISSFASVLSYFQSIFRQGRVEQYPGRDRQGHQIHFSVAVYFGFLLTLGAFYGEYLRNFI